MTASDANRLRHMLDAAREAVEFGAGLALPLYPVERLQNLPRGVVQRDRASVGTAHGAIRGGQRAQQPFHFGGVQAGVDFDGGPAGDGDRKSTRLNSSHLGISYAVFCLKKKKT